MRGGMAGRDKQMTATLDQVAADPQQTIAELQQRLDVARQARGRFEIPDYAEPDDATAQIYPE